MFDIIVMLYLLDTSGISMNKYCLNQKLNIDINEMHFILEKPYYVFDVIVQGTSL